MIMNMLQIKKAIQLIEEAGIDIDKKYLDAEHDIIYFPFSLEEIPEDSELGSAFEELGLHVDSEYDCWATF